MPESCEKIWANVLQNLEGHVSPATFNLWFRNTKLLSLDESRCTIGVPNSYTATWLQKRFSSVIGDVLNTSLGREVNIGFFVNEQGTSCRQEDIATKEVTKETAEDKRPSKPPRANHRVLRLEEFVVGPSNQLAYTSALEMLRTPVPPFNPLFIYGLVGLGKTHILQGIWNRINTNGNETSNRAIYMPAEDWTNEFISALKKGRVESFRNKYRKADVLLIDDVHFLSNKHGIQEEFLHTFNTLYHSSKRIIFASDAHPKFIKQLKESLASRMMAGMVAEIHPPDFTTSLAILRAKVKVTGRNMSEEVLEYMAERLKKKSVREFESALTAITAIAAAYKKKINVPLVKDVLSSVSTRKPRNIRIEDIEKGVCNYFQLSPEELRSANKKRSQVLPIHLSCYLARTLTSASYQEIGSYFGNRRHTTCIAAKRKIKKRLETDREFRDLVDRLSEEIRQSPL